MRPWRRTVFHTEGINPEILSFVWKSSTATYRYESTSYIEHSKYHLNTSLGAKRNLWKGKMATARICDFQKNIHLSQPQDSMGSPHHPEPWRIKGQFNLGCKHSTGLLKLGGRIVQLVNSSTWLYFKKLDQSFIWIRLKMQALTEFRNFLV